MIALVALSALAAPAYAKGPVVAYFDTPPEETLSALAEGCINRGITVSEQDAHHVRCEQEMTGFGGFLHNLLLAPRYSTPSTSVVRFAVSKGRNGTVVQASAWIEVQTAFSQIRRTPMDGKKPSRQLRDFMLSAGGYEFPPPPKQAEAETQAPAAPAPVATPPAPPPKATPPAQSGFGNKRVRCLTCR